MIFRFYSGETKCQYLVKLGRISIVSPNPFYACVNCITNDEMVSMACIINEAFYQTSNIQTGFQRFQATTMQEQNNNTVGEETK